LENYYPNNDEGLGLSIALSIGSTTWNPKCWLSTKINNTSDNSKPKYHSPYNEFKHNDVHYYPYSIGISSHNMLDILDICDGLYRFVQENIAQ
jgi:hypothetical protein